MAPDSKNKRVAIIGAGAAGCMCAYFLLNSVTPAQPSLSMNGVSVTLFDKGTPLRTILPTGGGRCNLAHAEFNPKDLASNYPRGEKFLYSIFSQYSTSDTLETFEKLGIKTYIQENGRIFPESNSAKEVRSALLKEISKAQFVKEEVVEIEVIDGGFKIKTCPPSSGFQPPSPIKVEGKFTEYYFTDVVIAIGGHAGYKLAENLGIKTIAPKPSLVGLNTKENFKDLSGTVVKDVSFKGLVDNVLFTHFGVSGPLVYTISSIKAFEQMPYTLNLDLCPNLIDLQNDLNTCPHKEIKNILTKYLPQKIVSYILKDIDETTKAHKINGKTRDAILDKIHNFQIVITGTNKGEETVTAGGIDLDQINSKTMEVKNIPNLYCIGEVLNIDGFCGGFNLQNAWSTAYVCSKALTN